MKSYSKNKYNRGYIGPGGWKCVCCAPAKSYRKKYKRIIKHIEEREEMKIEMEQCEE
jgi:hypothetical protein